MLAIFDGIIRYLVIDFECRKNHLGEWVICSAAISGLDQKLRIIFESMEFTAGSHFQTPQWKNKMLSKAMPRH